MKNKRKQPKHESDVDFFNSVRNDTLKVNKAGKPKFPANRFGDFNKDEIKYLDGVNLGLTIAFIVLLVLSVFFFVVQRTEINELKRDLAQEKYLIVDPRN